MGPILQLRHHAAHSSLLFLLPLRDFTPSLSVARAHRYGSPSDYKSAVQELRSLFSEENDTLTIDPEELLLHGGSTWTHLASQPPSVVVFPSNQSDVEKILEISRKYRVPVVPYGAGSAVEGQFNAPYGGICIDLQRHMNKIIKINSADGDCVVQPGISYQELNDELARLGHKLFLPLDPGPGATIGGMISTGCSGTNTVRYGTARAEWFLNLTAVLPSGQVLKTRSRARKSSAGPDLTKVFIGAEGTLGVITEVAVRLAPLLPTRVGMVGFPGVKQAVEAVVEILGEGVVDTIFFKFQGSDVLIAESAKTVETIIKRHGGDALQLATTEKESELLWGARRGALFASMAASGYETPMIYGNDICVPVSRLPDFISECKSLLYEAGVYAPFLGHVGDGNIHMNVVLRDRSELPKMHGLMKKFIWKAIEMEGTCTGEHGVGANKKEYLTTELGVGTISLLRTIKNAIDPLGLMNPGKLYPDELPPLAPFPDPSQRTGELYAPAAGCSC
ncbi:hypothetical protein BDY24DRAFT_406069 [Mrakia frigida]|uniref:FAD-binding oxidoreductase n=1 Tax=Mrakia frigida TaxID=29902 RepID=UPI003FCC0869